MQRISPSAGEEMKAWKQSQRKVFAGGRVTIPKEIREHLNLKPGDKVKFFKRGNGGVLMIPVEEMKQPPKRWKGRPVTIQQMNKAIAQEATARYRRFLEQSAE